MKPQQWTLVTHDDFFRSLHTLRQRGEDIYRLSNAIWGALAEAEDPTKGATPIPEKSGSYEKEFMGCLLTFEVLEKERKIRLLLLETIE